MMLLKHQKLLSNNLNIRDMVLCRETNTYTQQLVNKEKFAKRQPIAVFA